MGCICDHCQKRTGKGISYLATNFIAICDYDEFVFFDFGQFIGEKVGQIQGVPYINYIVPGLIMMSVITNSYSNVTSTFFSSKFQRYIDELLVSPTHNMTILLGYLSGGLSEVLWWLFW